MTAKLGLCEKVNTDMIADENLKIIFSSLDDIETFISDTYNWADSQWTIDKGYHSYGTSHRAKFYTDDNQYYLNGYYL